jgi:hypothetical protein
MKLFALSLLLLGAAAFAADPPKATAEKPAIKVMADGFPSGHDSPEGVASDLARAFIKRDYSLFESSCIKPFGEGESRKDYEKFIAGVKDGMKAEAERKEPSPGGPKAIAKIYAARHLSMNGPASAGYAMFDFHDIMFVDVVATLHNGKETLIRTMVIKTAKGQWFAHPAPHTAQLLSMGLNDEKPSEKLFGDVYKVEKP